MKIIKQTKKIIECPYCENSHFYKDWAELEEHKKNCPDQFKNPQQRFNAWLKKYKIK